MGAMVVLLAPTALEPNTLPFMDFSFIVSGRQQKVSIKLPISVNKFMEPTEMNGEAFFSRWKNLSM